MQRLPVAESLMPGPKVCIRGIGFDQRRSPRHGDRIFQFTVNFLASTGAGFVRRPCPL